MLIRKLIRESEVLQRNDGMYPLTQSMITSIPNCWVLETTEPSYAEVEKAVNWLRREGTEKKQSLRTEYNLFGTVTLVVPVNKCNPRLVAEIMAFNGAELETWEAIYEYSGIPEINQRKTLLRVRMSYRTDKVGILNEVIV